MSDVRSSLGLWFGAAGLSAVLAWPAALPAQETSKEDSQDSATAPEADAQNDGQPAADDAPETVATIPVNDTTTEGEAPVTVTVTVPADATRLDDITVTSGKRVKSQRDIPASVGAFRGEDLEKINAISIKDYLKTVPGVSLVEREQDRTTVTIRGISVSTSFSTSTTAGTTGIFLDELPLNDAFRQLTVPDINPFDLERVEVLKGPQGTLFGAGALAGAVRYITKKPDMGVWNAKLQSTYSANEFGEPRKFIAGAVNIPVYRDEAALRVAVTYLERGGLINKNSSFEGPDEGEANLPEGARDSQLGATDNGIDTDDLVQHTVRASGQWDFSDRLRFNALGLYQSSGFDDSAQVDNFKGDFSSRNDVTASPGDGIFAAYNFVPSYAFDWGTLTSSSGYVTKDANNRSAIITNVGEETVTSPNDGEPGDDVGTEELGAGPTRPIPFGAEQKAVIQEIRLASPEGADSRWEWLGGLSYYKSNQYYYNITPTSAEFTDTRNGLPVNPCQAPACPVPTPAGNINGQEYELSIAINDSEGEEMALFGEATYRFLEDERLEATLGGRLFRNRLQAYLEGRGLTTPTATTRASYQEFNDYKEDGFNPKASLRYIITPNIQTYVLAAKGFQFGGVQLLPPLTGSAAIIPEEAVATYNSSKLWLYEWGWRTDWFERRMRLDWTAYYYDWTDLQLRVDNLLPNPLPKDPEFPNDVPVFEDGVRDEQTRRRPFGAYITNLGRAKSTGLEASFSISPARGLTFVSSANWLKARLVEDYVGPDGRIIPAGSRLAGSPDFQISNSLSYTTPFSLLGEWEGGGSLSHTHVSDTVANLDEFRATEKFDTLNAQIHLGKPGWALSPDLRFTVSNLTDVRAIQGLSGTTAGRNLKVYYNQPRTAILALDLKW